MLIIWLLIEGWKNKWNKKDQVKVFIWNLTQVENWYNIMQIFSYLNMSLSQLLSIL